MKGKTELVFFKKRLILTIFIIILLCNLVILLNLTQNLQKITHTARLASSHSLIIKNGVYIYENQTFTAFSFTENDTYVFKNCLFDCDDLNFPLSVKVSFQNCTIITNKFHTGSFTRAIVPSTYAVGINLTQSNLTFRLVPILDVVHHTDFVFLGTSIIRIENSNISAPARQLEPHEDSKIIINNSVLNLRSIKIFERANLIVENSIVESEMNSVGDFYDITPPHNPSLFIQNSHVSGAIWNLGLNSTTTIQNSTVDLLVKTLWVTGSACLSDSEIVSGSSFSVTNIDTDESSHWMEIQYLVVGTEGAIIQIDSSMIYGLACNDSKVYISNSFVTDFISGVGTTTQISIANSVLLGKGFIGKTSGVIMPYTAASIFNKYENAPQLTSIFLVNCTINGTISTFTETIILQNCHLPLGQWNDTIVPASNEFVIVIIDTESPQYLAGNTSIDILVGSAYLIAESAFYINNILLSESEILNRSMDFFNILGGWKVVIQSYLHYTYDFTNSFGQIKFSIVITNGYDTSARNFTLTAQNNPSSFIQILTIFVIILLCTLVVLLLLTHYLRKITNTAKLPSSHS